MVSSKTTSRYFQQLTLVLMFLISIDGNAFNNEPDGFRGIRWGTNFSENQSEMTREDVSDSDSSTKYYSRKNDKPNIGEANIERIVYRYKNDQFIGIIALVAKGLANRVSIKSALEAQFGNGFQSNKYIEEYQWFGNATHIKLKCDILENCTLFIQSKSAIEQSIKESNKKAKDAAKDF